MIDEDEIVYNDDNQAQEDLIEAMQRQAELDFEGKIVYNENGVEFTSAPAYMNYVIITDIYQIYWYVPQGLSIFDKRKISANANIHSSKCVLDLPDKPFNMAYFATLKDPSLLPGDLEFIWSSAEFVNHQVERLLNLRVFL